MNSTLCDEINFTSSTPITEIISKSIEKWIEKNVSVSGYLKKNTRKLEIYIGGKKTGWFVDKDNYNEVDGIGYLTTPFAKLQYYPGYREGLAMEVEK